MFSIPAPRRRILLTLDITTRLRISRLGKPTLTFHRVLIALIVSFVALGLWTPQTVYAKADVPEDDPLHSLELVGHIGGRTAAVYVVDNLTYIGQGAHLSILDISNPAHPILLGKTAPMSGLISNVVVADGFAYVTPAYGGLQVVDVRISSAPIAVGNIYGGNSIASVFIRDKLAYVVSGNSLFVVNVTTPSAPVEIGAYDGTTRTNDVFVSGNLAYIASGGLLIIDVSRPRVPVKVGAYNIPEYAATDVLVSGSLAYVATSNSYYGDDGGQLRIVDISTPSTPVEVGSFNTSGSVHSIFVAGGMTYMANGDMGLQMVDVSAPSTPVEAGRHDTPGDALDISVIDGLAYVADDQGLRLVDVGTPSAPREVGSYNITPINAQAVFAANNLVYVAGGDGGLQIVDASTPSAPVQVGVYDTPGNARDIVVADSLAYVADGSGGLQIVDVSTPSAPVGVGTFGLGGGISVSGSHAYVFDNGLTIVDVSTPSAPVKVGVYHNTDYFYNDLFVSGNWVYMTDSYSSVTSSSGGLQIIDVSTPDTPVEVGRVSLRSPARGIFVSGNLAYVAYGHYSRPYESGGFFVVDVSTPSAPIQIERFHTSNDYAVDISVVADSVAYLIDYDHGLVAVDVRTPADPVVLDTYDIPGYPEDIFVSDGFVYVADGDSGLYIFQYSGSIFPPEVQTTSPQPNAVGVSASAAPIYTDTVGAAYAPNITINFTKALDKTTVTTTTISLMDGTGALVPATLRSEDSHVVLTPRVPLSTGRYTATVTTGVMDLTGAPLFAHHVWSFDVVVQRYRRFFLPLLNKNQSSSPCVDIPWSECKALQAIKAANTNPEEYALPSLVDNWFRSAYACSWPGIECADSHVTILRLPQSSIAKLPPEIGNLVHLRELNLSENNLTTHLTSLTRLNILTFWGTTWCVPTTGPVSAWLSTIPNVYGSGLICSTL